MYKKYPMQLLAESVAFQTSYIIIIIIIIRSRSSIYEVFTGVWTTSNLFQDSSDYSGQSQQCSRLGGIDSSSDLQFFKFFGTLPRTTFTIGMTVTLMFHGYFKSILARSKYFFISLSFIFILWSAGTAKSTRWQVLSFFFFFFFINTRYNLLSGKRWSVCISKSQRTFSWEDKGVHTFPRGICPKVNVIALLEYELAYCESAVNRFNHYTTRTRPTSFVYKHKTSRAFAYYVINRLFAFSA